jgi:hypothetical protein
MESFFGYDYYERIDKSLSSILSQFSNLICFAFYGGKAAYNILTEKSDIDLIVVFRDPNSKKETQSMLNAIAVIKRKYFELHKELNLIPDKTWPSEFLTEGMLKEVLLGRGFDVLDGKLGFIKLSSPEQYTINRMYRYWWGFMLFSRYFFGDRAKFSHYKRKLWELITTYMIYHIYSSRKGKIGIYDLYKYMVNGKSLIGVKRVYDRTLSFKISTLSILGQTCRELGKSKGFLRASDDFISVIDDYKLNDIVKGITDRVMSENWKTKPFKGYFYYR